MAWTINQFELAMTTGRKLKHHREGLRVQCVSWKANFTNSGPYTTAAILSRAQDYATSVNNFLDKLQANQTEIETAIR